jgi:hypothetical protein
VIAHRADARRRDADRRAGEFAGRPGAAGELERELRPAMSPGAGA